MKSHHIDNEYDNPVAYAEETSNKVTSFFKYNVWFVVGV
jgi:hypothetical protein